mmetsp:Transcript_15182/g.20720  ORF Transcript_15182/g.20720 Transcript_15182/m.20720 type:complete len:144 (-) Transcript_15182:75-506(-)
MLSDQHLCIFHVIFFSAVQLDVLLLLLEKWPEATRERDCEGTIPIDTYKQQGNPEGNVLKVLSYVFQLCGDTVDILTLKEILHFFAKIKWSKGVSLMLDRHPSLTNHMDIGTSTFPKFLSVVGRGCKMKTMWYVISNQLDIIQ